MTVEFARGFARGFAPRHEAVWPTPSRAAGAASDDRVASAAPLFEPRPPAPPDAVSLLAQARRGLAEAGREAAPAARFEASYLAALRAAAAVLVVRGRPHRRAAKPESAWRLLASTAPELGEWVEYFAAHSATHAAAQAGITRRIDTALADELRARAGEFVALGHRVVHGEHRDPGTPGCGARSRAPRRRRR
ncbi:SAV_6107 family HEPN domain-containing protein [Saccharomonospora piscinae]|uniref:SAV_6107 family HEPN domain-containing protein n=1 Tax=Saccharomonospora piscinae TaxID=687388 RepID=UPI000467173F|nr:SAV_6107 family HEPN domain-containing protein [Saccharomonospora piscinae]